MLEPIKATDPDFIVAWHSKKAHKAGKYLDKVMTYGEALEQAEQLAGEHPENAYWAEHIPRTYAPH